MTRHGGHSKHYKTGNMLQHGTQDAAKFINEESEKAARKRKRLKEKMYKTVREALEKS